MSILNAQALMYVEYAKPCDLKHVQCCFSSVESFLFRYVTYTFCFSTLDWGRDQPEGNDEHCAGLLHDASFDWHDVRCAGRLLVPLCERP